MRKAKAPAVKDPYLVLTKGLVKGVYAQSPDMAWEKYRDQLAQLHATTDREDVRQRMAWGAYQDLLRQNHEDMYRSFAKADGDAVPPEAVRAACRQGLKLAPEHGGDGLTDGAKARARSMAAGHAVSQRNLNRMVSFFARHTETKTANPPSPGYVSWLLWGGDAGKSWAGKQATTQKGEKPLGAAFSHGRAVAKRKGKAGNKKVAHAAAQRYLTANGHGKMGGDK